MSYFDRCIKGKVEAGELSKKRADEVFVKMENLHDVYHRQGMSGYDAERLAESQVLKEITEDIETKRVQTALRLQARDDILGKMQDFGDEKGGWGERANQLLTDYQVRRQSLRGLMFRKMSDVVEKYRTTVGASVMRKFEGMDGQYDILRELLGVNTGNVEAQKFAQAFRESTSFGLGEFNRASGNVVRELEDFGIPRDWDHIALSKKLGREGFVKMVVTKNDWERTERVLGYAISPANRERFAGEAYDGIISNGLNKITPGAFGLPSLANSRGEPRKLFFKPEDEVSLRQDGLVKGTVFESMVSHIDSLAHDVAMMNTFGPNPNNTAMWMKGLVDQHAAEINVKAKGDKDGYVQGQRRKMAAFNTGFRLANGTLISADPTIAAMAVRNSRTILSTIWLSRAGVTSIFSDMLNTGYVSARYAGSSYPRFLKEYFKTIGTGRHDIMRAQRHGIVADTFVATAMNQMRYFAEMDVNSGVHKFSNTWLRLTGLLPITQVGRTATAKLMMGELADEAGKAMSAMSPARQKLFERYGITAEDWDIIRQHGIEKDQGVTWLTPGALADSEKLGEKATDYALKLSDMINGETRYFIPEPGLRAQASTPWGFNINGTFWGEITASSRMFLGTMIEFYHTHLKRAMDGGFNARYLAALTTTGSFAAAMAYQVNALLDGKDPADMTDPMFWLNVQKNNGALAVAGAYLFNDGEQYGGWSGLIAGGLVGFGSDVWSATAGAEMRALKGEKVNRAKWYNKVLRRVTPRTPFPYVSLAFERMVMDELQEATDPTAQRTFRERVKNARKSSGQDYWWAPGAKSPRRAPNLMNAVGAP